MNKSKFPADFEIKDKRSNICMTNDKYNLVTIHGY